VTDPLEAFAGVVAELQPLLEQHGFQRAERMDALLAPGTPHAGFAAGIEAVRLVWGDKEKGGYVVLEALEPEYGGTWTDMLLKHIDLRRATSAELAYLVEILREELVDYYFQQIQK
jgi:hypothetical protein